MKYSLVALFILSLLSVCFLSLNYIWDWFAIDYSQVMKLTFSALILLLAITGLAMIFSGANSKNQNQPNVGKR